MNCINFTCLIQPQGRSKWPLLSLPVSAFLFLMVPVYSFLFAALDKTVNEMSALLQEAYLWAPQRSSSGTQVEPLPTDNCHSTGHSPSLYMDCVTCHEDRSFCGFSLPTPYGIHLVTMWTPLWWPQATGQAVPLLLSLLSLFSQPVSPPLDFSVEEQVPLPSTDPSWILKHTIWLHQEPFPTCLRAADGEHTSIRSSDASSWE